MPQKTNNFTTGKFEWLPKAAKILLGIIIVLVIALGIWALITRAAIPQISKASGEPDLSLTYQSDPEGYNMARTGMSFDGVDYTDPNIVSDPPTSGAYFNTDNFNTVFPLPGLIPPLESGKDIYVYLASFTVPAGLVGNPEEMHFNWTVYSQDDPEAARQFVTGINRLGFLMTVDAFAKAFTDSGNNTYTPATLPISSEGRIVYTPSAPRDPHPAITLDPGSSNPPALVYDSALSHYKMDMAVLNYDGEQYKSLETDDDGNILYGHNVSMWSNGGLAGLGVTSNGTLIYNPDPSKGEFGVDGTSNLDALLLAGQGKDGPTIATLFVADPNKQDLVSGLASYNFNIVCDINNLFTNNGSGSPYTWNPSALASSTCITLGSAQILPPGGGEPDDTTPPDAPVITEVDGQAPVNNGVIGETNSPTIKVEGEPGSYIKVYRTTK